jgi:hypothetical protein
MYCGNAIPVLRLNDAIAPRVLGWGSKIINRDVLVTARLETSDPKHTITYFLDKSRAPSS